MKQVTVFLIFCFFQSMLVFSQENNSPSLAKYKFEDKNGNIITDPVEYEQLVLKRNSLIQKNALTNKTNTQVLQAVQLCTNSGFEEFVTDSGSNVLKNFQFTIGEPLNPIQCKSVDVVANTDIKQYKPNATNEMASTVPANYLDDYIGNINGFDQYCLKLNFQDSYTTMAVVQAKRFKTDNEKFLKFNYKAVLQSVQGSAHLNEQPYFKARILNKNGTVVSEFCLIGDPQNCIYTQADVLQGGNIILYTKNWQSGSLDISSIPNNENFTIEFMTTRCGLGGHFGYSYIDDICMSHSDENLQGSINLDPLFLSCPTTPLSICGDFTVPNSGSIKASVKTIELKIYNSANKLIHTTSKPTSIDLDKKRFCFDVALSVFPNITTENYNLSASIEYTIDKTDCPGTVFDKITDDDANPGWDITFLNCDPKCTLALNTANLSLCDDDKNGKETFDLTNLEPLVTGTQTGITFSYYNTLSDATAAINPILDFKKHESFSTTLYVRAKESDKCYKIIAVQLIVRNPVANISGVLNVCNGSTLLTATKGSSYLWSNGELNQSISATQTGLYTVTVTDAMGCEAKGQVTILPNTIAAQPTIVVTQPNCLSAKGTITISSPAVSYSYDNGTNWSTSATASNLSIGTYNIKIRTIAGCESYESKITLNPFFSSYPKYTKTDPKFCGDFGSITITTPATSYSFDDGLTWQNESIKTNLLSGSYKIRYKDDQGCESNYNNVELFSEFLPVPNYSKVDPYCATLGSISVTTPATDYSFDGGTTWQASNTLSNLNSGSKVIQIKNKLGCTSKTAYIYLSPFEYSYPNYTITDAGCNKYASIEIKTAGDSYSFDNGLNWSATPILSNLSGGSTHQLVVKKGTNCKTYQQIIYINSNFRPLPIVSKFETTLCDNLNDGVEIIDLTQYNSNLLLNTMPTTYSADYYASLEDLSKNKKITNFKTYTMGNSNPVVYTQFTSQYGCKSTTDLKLNFIDAPRIKMLDQYVLCLNKSININAGYGFDSYLWSNGENKEIATLFKPGNQWVNVTEKHGLLTCNSTKKFNVFLSSPATITNIITEDWSETENTIRVYTSGLGSYEYSLDNKNYQDNPSFTGIFEGKQTVYVRDKFDCGIASKDLQLLMYPKFFTPNADGVNDHWKIKFSNLELDLSVKIYDRNGQLLKILANSTESWDGKLNGNDLPADDYWFVVTRASGKELKGHFSLKR